VFHALKQQLILGSQLHRVRCVPSSFEDYLQPLGILLSSFCKSLWRGPCHLVLLSVSYGIASSPQVSLNLTTPWGILVGFAKRSQTNGTCGSPAITCSVRAAPARCWYDGCLVLYVEWPLPQCLEASFKSWKWWIQREKVWKSNKKSMN